MLGWKGLGIVSAVMLAGCAAMGSSPRPVGRLSVEALEQCLRSGGQPTEIGIGHEGCVRPATDGGTLCTDNSQCQGRCDAPFRTPKDTPASGTCSATVGMLGCVNVVLDGNASGEYCFD